MRIRRVLLIGWDGADWKIIHPLIEAGKMPNLERLINEGVMGNLATLYPSLSPTLWTSIATGKRPYKHRVLGFIEPDPMGERVRPITSLSRKSRALWNIMTLVGKRSVVVGWWPSHPAEPINGVMVSNRYQRAVAPYGRPWPMPPETVHPPRLREVLARLRLHPQELDVGLIMKFLPKLHEIDQEKDRRVETIAKIIADCTNVNRAATAILDHEPWDFAAIYYDGIDHFCHGFINYHPPRPEWVRQRDFELYCNVVEAGYIYHDLLLGTLLKRIDDETLVVLVSDHGFHSDHLRPRNIPVEPAGPAVQHRHYGIFVAKGPGIKKDEIVYGASLLDVCPTVLAALGLPVGEDMDGKVLINIFERPSRVRTIPSWDDVPGYDGSHPPDRRTDPVADTEAIRQLVELGYIEEPARDGRRAVEECIRELKYNEARAYMDAGLHAVAVSILEELTEGYPEEYRFGIHLVDCYLRMGQTDRARETLLRVFERKKGDSRRARTELREFMEDNRDRTPEDFTEEEVRKLRRLRARASTAPHVMEFLMGHLLLESGSAEEAVRHLERATKGEMVNCLFYNKLAEAYIKTERFQEAEDTLQRVLEMDPENSDAHRLLCSLYLKQRKDRDALEAGLRAVGLQFHNPVVHYMIGVALHRMGRVVEAVEALKVATIQNPNYPDPHRRLAYIYKRRLKDDVLADRHRRLAKEASERLKRVKRGELDEVQRQKEALRSLTSEQTDLFSMVSMEGGQSYEPERTVVVVSGLPRSGTSMMMQMLRAGGVPVLTDDVRGPDEDNPKGYLEYEKAKRLKNDTQWLREARGKAVKIVAQLLPYLPQDRELNYRVIFMLRDLDEVIASQRKMLQRQGRKGASLSEDALKRIFSHHLVRTRRFLAVREIPTLYIDYNETLRAPLETAEKVSEFLDGKLDIRAMAEAVDPSLKRQYRDRMGNQVEI